MLKRPWILLFTKIIADILTINASFLIGYFVKFNTLIIDFPHFYIYSRTLALATLIWIIIFNLGGLYKFPRGGVRGDGFLSSSLAITSASFITLLIIFFLYKEAAYAIDIVFYSWGSGLVLINASRSIIWFAYRHTALTR